MLQAPLTARNGFRTLGAAAYLDEPQEYEALASEMNPVLEQFRWVYQRLERALGVKDLRYGPALPGFHLFDYSPGAEASIHVDTPHERVTEFKDTDIQDTFSFTVAVQQPSEGAKLRIWDPELSTHQYKLGELFVHSGKQLHQIVNNLQPGEQRITLQGHGIITREYTQVFF